jgi:hypothetical protein
MPLISHCVPFGSFASLKIVSKLFARRRERPDDDEPCAFAMLRNLLICPVPTPVDRRLFMQGMRQPTP